MGEDSPQLPLCCDLTMRLRPLPQLQLPPVPVSRQEAGRVCRPVPETPPPPPLLPGAACSWPRRASPTALLSLHPLYLQPLQLLHVVKSPPFDHSNLVLHQLPGEAQRQRQLPMSAKDSWKQLARGGGAGAMPETRADPRPGPSPQNLLTTLQTSDWGSSAHPALTARHASSASPCRSL